ncbi:putative Cytoplasmic dynein heavy chain [Fasciola gigantica]|uniref:Putative Cytoplasmic dynein heavy chain n=1 Tax=Fasciola gigantica TaxID=46835 RepID=A0A504YPL2_FASGI|nr:putative Cytoplasmic dynein heavy chain [Fasciola gigantica]
MQIRKALEVYEQTKQRMGVVLVGPSGCGKSTVLTLLRLALSKIGHPVRYHVFNPKSMLRVQLLGRIDSDTREWTDGVLTHSARSVVKEDAEQHCWIVCDGDIDPEWVISRTRVWDDNRLLTLPSPVRADSIRDANVNFLFETHELTQASPATVSRMGVVYVSDEATDPKALVGAWLAQQTEADRGKLEMNAHQSCFLSVSRMGLSKCKNINLDLTKRFTTL